MEKHLISYKSWLNALSGREKEYLLKMGKDDNMIKERFLLPLEFGTAGMRGEIDLGTARMNIYTVRRATAGLAQFILAKGKAENGVVIAYDTRNMSTEFAQEAAEVLDSCGVKAYIFEDVRPVALCSFAVRYLGAAAGIMITASHNPKEYNGFKVYGADGAQLEPEDTKQVVSYINLIEDYFSVKANPVFKGKSITGLDNYKITDRVTVIGASVDEEYYKAVGALSLSKEVLKEQAGALKIVYTPIHGTGYKPVTEMLARIGIRPILVEEQCKRDSDFSTVTVPNPEYKETLSMAIELAGAHGADVVLGTDPDCDRLGVAIKDNKGDFIALSGNQIGVLLLDYILERLRAAGELPVNGAVIKTIVTSTLVDKIAQNYNVAVIDVLTGFKYIGEKIKLWEADNTHSFVFGFEESHGYLRGTHVRDKDGVIASMLFAEMVAYLKSKGESVYSRLIALFEKYGWYTESNLSIQYKGLQAMEEMRSIMEKLKSEKVWELDGYKVLYNIDYSKGEKTYADGRTEKTTLPLTNAVYYGLEDKNFVCVRPSGTEPKLKAYVMCCAKDKEQSRQKAETLMAAVKKLL
ncbi:MAG: phospho-sugar mutase [Christensenellales bacterium]|jgi:phosphoglucomutase